MTIRQLNFIERLSFSRPDTVAMMHSPPFRSPRDDAIRRRVQPLSEAAAAVPMDLSAISGSLCVVDCSELFEIIGEVHEPSAGKATPPPSTRLCPPSSFETIGRPREGYALWPPGTSLGRPTEKKRPQPHLDRRCDSTGSSESVIRNSCRVCESQLATLRRSTPATSAAEAAGCSCVWAALPQG